MAAPLAKEALLSGWRLIRGAPLAVLGWWFLRVAEEQSYQAINSLSDGPQSLVVAGLFVTLIFEAFLISAVFRALLRPEKPGLAWLRLSGVEAKMFALMVVTALIAFLIALPVSIGMSYGFWFARQPGLGLVVLSAGSVAAVLALLRFAPLPAILVDTGRVDLRAALNATRGRYWILVLFALVLGLIEQALAKAWDRALQPLLTAPEPPPKVIHISFWLSGPHLLQVAGHELLGILLLIFVSAAVVAIWRASKQTVD